MIGDTTLSNWIQILNQTLANQQAVIDSLQVSLASQDTQLDSTMIADMIAAVGGVGVGGGNTYVARAEFDATQALANIHFADFSGTGAHLTSGTGTSISGQFGNFTFAIEVAPPKSIFAYAGNTSTNEYILTHLNAGGDNAVYKIKGFTFTPYTSASGLANQFDAGIFSNFGGASIDIDLQKGNFDWQRVGFPSAKEAHVYLVFTF